MSTEGSGTAGPRGSGAIARGLFPPGNAAGGALVNRESEYRRLIDDVVAGRSAWFDCPQRYGVSTLINRACQDLRHWREPRMAIADCRLHSIHDTESFCVTMLEAMGQLASQVIRRANVLPDNVANLFTGVTKEIYLDVNHLQTIRLHPGERPLDTLLEVHTELDQMALQRGCRCVLIVRELQQLPALRSSKQLTQAMHSMIDSNRAFVWLMHGHNRSVMRSLFEGSKAPLHGRCRRFALRPINSETYSDYLGAAAQARWQCNIGVKAREMIVALTDRHPRWLNELCRRLWSADLPPVIQDVVNEWYALVDENRHVTGRELERLSPNQRAVLYCLAQTPTDKPRAKRFVARTRVSSASVGQAIRILEELDLICADAAGRWTVSDPVMQWSLHPRTDIVDEIYELGPDIRW
ncbi:MAG: hypothetical protein KJO54_03555 [Gammaproteobacteria bacterium]|nr:hypothetical protein [Gammaproteobacteria bacterium]NNF60858.1 hypothetical protein [Gammaproteobacteria bacterium]NNM21753.1 hypothetical protein [Gammaproteobacteria bacterium]